MELVEDQGALIHCWGRWQIKWHWVDGAKTNQWWVWIWSVLHGDVVVCVSYIGVREPKDFL